MRSAVPPHGFCKFQYSFIISCILLIYLLVFQTLYFPGISNPFHGRWGGGVGGGVDICWRQNESCTAVYWAFLFAAVIQWHRNCFTLLSQLQVN